MPRDPRLLLAIGVGGAVGSLLRALLEQAWGPDPASAGQWPWATLLVNLAGALVLGLVAARLRSGGTDVPMRERRLRGLLGTGLCGGLTTFSTLHVEIVDLLDSGAVALGLGYVAASVGLGVPLAWAGLRLGARGTPAADAERGAGLA